MEEEYDEKLKELR